MKSKNTPVLQEGRKDIHRVGAADLEPGSFTTDALNAGHAEPRRIAYLSSHALSRKRNV